MAACELSETCPFFNDQMAQMPASAEMFKRRYCKTDNSMCARYMVFKALGKPKVPPTLFPNNVEKAKAIIAEG